VKAVPNPVKQMSKTILRHTLITRIFLTFLLTSLSLCQIWNTCIVSWIYWSIAFLDKLLIFFSNKAYYQESYILIIAYSSVINVAEWLDGSFESQKAQHWFDNRKSQNMYINFLSLNQQKVKVHLYKNNSLKNNSLFEQ
jgi:hypothetical protein